MRITYRHKFHHAFAGRFRYRSSSFGESDIETKLVSEELIKEMKKVLSALAISSVTVEQEATAMLDST